MIPAIIAALKADGVWRGTLARAEIAALRLLGYTVRVLGPVGELFDVEVT